LIVPRVKRYLDPIQHLLLATLRVALNNVTLHFASEQCKRRVEYGPQLKLRHRSSHRSTQLITHRPLEDLFILNSARSDSPAITSLAVADFAM